MSAVLQPPIAERSDQIGSRAGGIYLGTWGTCRFMCHRGFSGYALDQVRGAYYAYNDRADELEDGEAVVSPAFTTREGHLIPFLLKRLQTAPERIKCPGGGNWLIDLFFPYGDPRLEPCFYADPRPC